MKKGGGAMLVILLPADDSNTVMYKHIAQDTAWSSPYKTFLAEPERA